MRTDQPSFVERRRRFAASLGDAVAIVPAGRAAVRNHDVEHLFRQDSDFFFLTGFEEPDAVALFNPAHPDEPYVLFVRPRLREEEIWTGYRAGVEGAVAEYGASAAYPIEELERHLRRHLAGAPALVYRLGNPHLDPMVTRVLRTGRAFAGRSGVSAPVEIRDPGPALADLRMVKSGEDLELLRAACAISAEGHLEAMRFARPGHHEYQVQAALEYVFRTGGSPRNGYPSIVASGPNAIILHYVENTRRMDAGDLLLIDAGAEFGFHSADITRTFPVDGRFTAAQRAIYDVVLSAERAGIETVKPGSTIRDVHDRARRTIAEGLVDLGLVPLGIDETLAMHHDREFFMHGTSHWLGMDVHDVGAYKIGDRHRTLEPRMAFTVEPGVYVDPACESVRFPLLEIDWDAWMERRYLLGTDEARTREREEKASAPGVDHPIPAELRGIGVRIEDDVVVTEDGSENLTGAVPVDPDDVEAVCAEAPMLPLPVTPQDARRS